MFLLMSRASQPDVGFIFDRHVELSLAREVNIDVESSLAQEVNTF